VHCVSLFSSANAGEQARERASVFKKSFRTFLRPVREKYLY
jgi:hypothetical protein